MIQKIGKQETQDTITIDNAGVVPTGFSRVFVGTIPVSSARSDAYVIQSFAG